MIYQDDYTPGEQIRQLKHWLLQEIMLKDNSGMVKRLRRVVARMMMRARVTG